MREEPLLERAALLRLRVDAAVLVRAEAGFERPAPPERADPAVLGLERPAGLGLELAPFGELLLRCELRELGLLLAIPLPLHSRTSLPRFGYPQYRAKNR